MVAAEICFVCSAGFGFSLFDISCFAGVQGRRFSEVSRPYLQEGYYDITGE